MSEFTQSMIISTLVLNIIGMGCCCETKDKMGFGLHLMWSVLWFISIYKDIL